MAPQDSLFALGVSLAALKLPLKYRFHYYLNGSQWLDLGKLSAFDWQ
ncbi:hypothetical protein EV13_2223 [Prochlorococcus sp. MIT 0702]|nr:hypothetical protein EV13_2223 [Prochlorococcus sp. MIT 0702]